MIRGEIVRIAVIFARYREVLATSWANGRIGCVAGADPLRSTVATQLRLQQVDRRARRQLETKSALHPALVDDASSPKQGAVLGTWG